MSVAVTDEEDEEKSLDEIIDDYSDDASAEPR
jgi:hypothetical protein